MLRIDVPTGTSRPVAKMAEVGRWVALLRPLYDPDHFRVIPSNPKRFLCFPKGSLKSLALRSEVSSHKSENLFRSSGIRPILTARSGYEPKGSVSGI